jgi:hypothetical protein
VAWEDAGGVASSLRGDTGAQSTIIPSLDALLGIQHAPGPLRLLLAELEYYRPPAHRAVLHSLREALWGSPQGSAADAADPDGDMLTNIQEYIFGTLPTSSQAPLLALSSLNSGNLTISFFGKEASGTGYTSLSRHYRVEKTLSLSSPDWQPLTGYEDITAGNSTISITEPTSGQGKSFYRLKSWLQ